MSDETVSSRWSRRKQAVAAEKLEAEKPLVEAAPVEPEKTEAEVLKEFGLKNPDDMEKGDDFSGFMNAAIPAQLRNRALRKLWASNPALRVVDGLVDYGEDFTGKGDIVGKIATAYKVGKGFVQKLDEDAEPDPKSDVVDDAVDSAEATEITEKPGAKRIESVRRPGTKPDLTPHTVAPREIETVLEIQNPPRVARKRMIFDHNKSE